MSGLDNRKDFNSLVRINIYKLFIKMILFHIINYLKLQTSPVEITDVKFVPYFTLRINPNIVQYVTESIIVFFSGCNVILYDFNTKEQKFLLRRNKQRMITFLSVGNSKSQQNKFDFNLTISRRARTQTNFNFVRNELKEKIICIGEYSKTEECFYVTTIKPFLNNNKNNNNYFCVKSPEKFWKINFCTILNNTNYCVALSQKKSNS